MVGAAPGYSEGQGKITIHRWHPGASATGNPRSSRGRRPSTRSLLEAGIGVARGHFGAFFKRAYRENDYLWGRLDGAERLIWMLFDAAGEVGDGGTVDRLTADAFREILKEERASLTEVQDVIEDIERVLDGRLASLPGCTQPPTRT